MEELRTYREASEYTLKSLVASGFQSDFVLQQLRSGKTLKEVFGNLQLQPSSSSAADESMGIRLLNMSIAGPDLEAVDDTHTSENGSITKQNVKEEQSAPSFGPWTVVTSDHALIKHLLTLYFCWEYPIFASVSKEHFLADFNTKRHTYCSSLLVNAILAVGCVFSRGAEDMTQTGHAVTKIGHQFFSEAERLWAIGRDDVSLTTVQALGIMSIFEASRGRDSQGAFYSDQSIRMAVGMGLHRDVDISQVSTAELEVRSATIWGAFSIDV